jgi:hypothetical protein
MYDDRMGIARSVIPVLVMLLSCLTSARAQDRGVYAGGGIVVSTWGPRESQESSPSLRFASSTGATVPGVSLEGGFLLGRVVAVGGELGIPARHEWTQTSTYLFRPFQRSIRYRDLTLAAVASVGGPMTSRVRAAFVGGIELVQQNASERTADGRIASNGTVVFGPFGEKRTLKSWTSGAILGGDLIVAASRHLTVVPQLRFHLIAREGVATSIGSLNVAARVLRAGVSIRATL